MEKVSLVSVLIPCRNEEKHLGECLDSVLEQQLDDVKLEIFVLDGHSADRTPEIIQSYAQKNDNLNHVKNDQKTTPFALNKGIKMANGEVIVILGAHAVMEADFVEQCLVAFRNAGKIGCVGGVLQNLFEDRTSQVISWAMSSPFGIGNANFRTGGNAGFVDTVAFGAYRAEVFNEIGLFDEDLVRNQDDEFNARLRKAGYRIYFSPLIRSKYYVRASFKKLFKQYYQYGYWKVYVNLKHKTVTTWRQLIPPAWVAFLTLGGALTLVLREFAFLFFLGLGLYVLFAFVFAFKKTKSLQFTGVVWAFIILHLAYGMGYWEGIFRFLILAKKPATKHQSITR